MFDIRTENYGKAARFVNTLKRRFKDLRPFWRRFLTSLVIAEIEEIILSEGRGTWAPLREEYAEQKREERPGKTILRYDDRILKSLETEGAVGNISDVKPQYMVWGLDAEQFRQFGDGGAYPRYHELGVGVPRRAIFDPILWGGRFERHVKSLGEKWSDHAIMEAERHHGFA